LSHYTIGAVVA